MPKSPGVTPRVVIASTPTPLEPQAPLGIVIPISQGNEDAKAQEGQNLVKSHTPRSGT